MMKNCVLSAFCWQRKNKKQVVLDGRFRYYRARTSSVGQTAVSPQRHFSTSDGKVIEEATIDVSDGI